VGYVTGNEHVEGAGRVSICLVLVFCLAGLTGTGQHYVQDWPLRVGRSITSTTEEAEELIWVFVVFVFLLHEHGKDERQIPSL
jgi:hypothetical protein